MKKKLMILLMTTTLLMALSACEEKSASPETSKALVDATTSDTTQVETSSEETSETSTEELTEASSEELTETSSEEPSETASGESEEMKNARLEEYQFALQQIAFEHVYPDGRDTGFDNTYGFIEDNWFALYDVTGDGVDELIVQFITAPVAGNTETIYTYQTTDGTLKPILVGFAGLTYYSNGVIKEKWSHSSGLTGEEYWPYTIYQYNAAEGNFEEIARVDMWSKDVSTVGYGGEAYPDDIDVEGAGTVFFVTHQGMEDTLSKTDYEKWLADTMGSATEVEIPYQSLNEENIKMMY